MEPSNRRDPVCAGHCRRVAHPARRHRQMRGSDPHICISGSALWVRPPPMPGRSRSPDVNLLVARIGGPCGLMPTRGGSRPYPLVCRAWTWETPEVSASASSECLPIETRAQRAGRLIHRAVRYIFPLALGFGSVGGIYSHSCLLNAPLPPHMCLTVRRTLRSAKPLKSRWNFAAEYRSGCPLRGPPSDV